MEVGSKYKLHLAGNLANRTLRIERFYAYWGQDLDTMATPYESGRDFRVKLDHVCSDINFLLCFCSFIILFKDSHAIIIFFLSRNTISLERKLF